MFCNEWINIWMRNIDMKSCINKQIGIYSLFQRLLREESRRSKLIFEIVKIFKFNTINR